MSYQFTISDIGLRLIKAYEGYWPEARALVSGGKVVGFGHKVDNDAIESLTEDEAEDVLKTDLAPIEDLINSRVHASMSQSQFDALCSLVFSIGEDAFMGSNMLHALNKGQVIEASNGFDHWRKGNINGQVYVVDALVRRRTAEKALFLRPTQRIARAPRFELTAVKDSSGPLANEPVYEEVIAGTVPDVPIAQEPAPSTTRQTLAASASPVIYADDTAEENLTDLEDLTARFEAQTPVTDIPAPESAQSIPHIVPLDDKPEFETIKTETVRRPVSTPEPIQNETLEEETSPIAAAAAEVSDRLDALIDNKDGPSSANDQWPDSLITKSITPVQNQPQKSDVFIDNMAQDDALREQIARESQYNVERYDDYVEFDDGSRRRMMWTFGTMVFLGLIASVVGFTINILGSARILGENGPFIAVAAMLIGFLLFIVGGFYLVRAFLARD